MAIPWYWIRSSAGSILPHCEQATRAPASAALGEEDAFPPGPARPFRSGIPPPAPPPDRPLQRPNVKTSSANLLLILFSQHGVPKELASPCAASRTGPLRVVAGRATMTFGLSFLVSPTPRAHAAPPP